MKRPATGYLEGEVRELGSAVAEAIRDEIPEKVLARRISSVFGAMRSHGRKWGYRCEVSKQMAAELITSPCHYCGHSHPAGIGIDRVDSRVGYKLGNVVPCCAECNMLMGDIPAEAKEILRPALQLIREHDYFGWVAAPKRLVVKKSLASVRKLTKRELERVVATAQKRVSEERERLGVRWTESHPSFCPEVERVSAFTPAREDYVAVYESRPVEVVRKRGRPSG